MSNFDDCVRARMDNIERFNQWERLTYEELVYLGCTTDWAHQLVHAPEVTTLWDTQVVAPVSMALILVNTYGNPAQYEDEAIAEFEKQFPYNQEG